MEPTTSAPSTELDVLSNRLAEMEAAQAAADGRPAQGQPGASATEAAERTAAAGEAGTKPSTETAGTPSATEAARKTTEDNKGNEETKAGEAGGKTGAEAPDKGGDKGTDKGQGKGSKYAQDLERREKSWKALNEQKSAFEQEKARLQQEIQAERGKLQAEREQFQQEQERSRASQTPESYDKWAAAQGTKAGQLEQAAKAAEDAGDFDKAEKLKEAATLARAYERMAKQQADELRRNPPPTDKQRQEQHQAAEKEWTLKAATDFPEFGKSQSPVQKETVSFLQMIGKQFPMLGRIPQLVYFAAERAQLKTAADRVPGLEKEVGELRKKVKELEGLTNPGSPGGSAQRLPGEKSWNEKTPEEQLAQLKSEAAAMS